MSVYMTEEDQIEAIKKWWNRYSGMFTVCLSIIVLIFSAYKYWIWHEHKISQEASNAYEHLMLALSNQDNKKVKGFANQLISDYSKTVYADVAHLTLAKLDVSHEKYSDAQKELRYVAKHSKMVALQDVAKIRLARLLVAEESYDAALGELETIKNSTYLPVVSEVKGDIFAATNRDSEALMAYRDALQALQVDGLANLFLEMKASELEAKMHVKTN